MKRNKLKFELLLSCVYFGGCRGQVKCGILIFFVVDCGCWNLKNLSKVKSRVSWVVVSAVVLRYIRPVVDSECSIWETLEIDPCSP